MGQEWQYQVELFGSAWRAARPEEVEAFLNEVAVEGWELGQAVSMSGGNKLLVIVKRKLGERTRRRKSTWP